jgi:hypothetical protein
MSQTAILILLVIAFAGLAAFFATRRRRHNHHHRHTSKPQLAQQQPQPPQSITIIAPPQDHHHHDGTLFEALSNTPVHPDGWEKVGLLYSSKPHKTPLQLFRRFIDRHRWEYMVQLKNDVAVPLSRRHYYDLSSGDKVIVPTKEQNGPYRVKLYVSDELRYDPFVV